LAQRPPAKPSGNGGAAFHNPRRRTLKAELENPAAEKFERQQTKIGEII
jgi:hypothetical protein